jgi:molecular chaperone DnaK (HSP70)
MVQVTFDIDAGGSLRVSVVDVASKRERSILIDATTVMVEKTPSGQIVAMLDPCPL